MNYNHLCFFLFFSVVVEVYGQENIALKAVPFEVGDQSFYIEGVIDDREEKHVGYHKDPNGKRVKLRLDGGASRAVQEFIDISFPHLENSQPVYIKIKALDVQESKRRMNNLIARIARAHVALAFYEKNNDELVELFNIKHNEDQVFYLPDKEELFETHEKRIRAALEYCMLAFTDNYQKK